MKNKVYNSLNNIFPDESQKQRMLQNIKKPREKLGGKIFTLATIATCFIFILILFGSKDSTMNMPNPRVINLFYEQEDMIYYQEQCYQLYNKEMIRFGKKIDQYQGYEVYQLTDEIIALVKENVYKLYKKCERN